MGSKESEKSRKKLLRRKRDRYLDRRTGEERRTVYSLDYLEKNPDRRLGLERRGRDERRKDCIRVNEWSSVCPDKNEIEEGKPYIIK
jgi:hypothetical protein